jgi:hypothetical protein
VLSFHLSLHQYPSVILDRDHVVHILCFLGYLVISASLIVTPPVHSTFTISGGRHQTRAHLVVSHDGQQAAVQDDDLFA